jgi:UDP-N-acetylglucosamine--dolichyl-phosphate N-acetylglucosaminephosphotransferase
MTFAVVGIIGHFSKTMLLFFIPQIINFLLSIPQLFHFIPCPRHRLPRFEQQHHILKILFFFLFRLNPDTNKLNPSEIEFKKKDLKFLGWCMLRFFSLTKFIKYREYKMNDNEIMIATTNFTIINTVLCWTGPLHEKTLTQILLFIQVNDDLIKLYSIYCFVLDYLR